MSRGKILEVYSNIIPEDFIDIYYNSSLDTQNELKRLFDYIVSDFEIEDSVFQSEDIILEFVQFVINSADEVTPDMFLALIRSFYDFAKRFASQTMISREYVWQQFRKYIRGEYHLPEIVHEP